jgi:hypothetical protein
MPEQWGRIKHIQGSDLPGGRAPALCEVNGMRLKSQATEPQDSLPDDVREAMAYFEREIASQENILYGVALFFEGISILYEEQHEAIETYRNQFRNIIESMGGVIEKARSVLEQVKKNPSKVKLLKEFKFSPCEGHPDPAEMVKRARILVKTYGETFPNRPRSQSFTADETFRLMEAVSEKLA